MVLSRAGLAAMVVVDAVMIARYGSDELAVSRLAEGTFGRLADVFAAFMHAALVLVAVAPAPACSARRLAVWRRALACAATMGLLGLGCAWLAPSLLLAAGQEPALVREAGTVILVLALGLPAGLVALACAVHLEGIGRAGLVARWMLGANALNILLNWLMIGGNAGLPAWGAAGSAAATGLVRVALAVVLVAAVLRIERPAPAAASSDTDRADHWKLGFGAAGASGVMHLLGVWLTVFAGWLGALPLAAFASCWILGLPGLLLAAGIGDAIAVRIAGDGPGDRARRLRSDLATLALVLATPAAIIVVAPLGVASLYTPDPVLAAELALLLPLAGVVLLLDGLSYGAVAALRGTRDVAVPTAIQIGAMAATPPLAALFTFSWAMGVYGLVLAILVTSAARLTGLGLRLILIVGPASADAFRGEREAT